MYAFAKKYNVAVNDKAFLQVPVGTANAALLKLFYFKMVDSLFVQFGARYGKGNGLAAVGFLYYFYTGTMNRRGVGPCIYFNIYIVKAQIRQIYYIGPAKC
ncbi:hypothetical protein ADICEAN_00604 [Cesiribacter andamanensis AMV16]|uniref:Uncharacterized protein n=1 Tax=Cesiribacter andamanensis AMV16 TaxID=1279009 RepID=M7NAG9_9BACT|nr:hypothetical protein ADICEAN_00604 [Cesiribacter andamanensis AMV16]